MFELAYDGINVGPRQMPQLECVGLGVPHQHVERQQQVCVFNDNQRRVSVTDDHLFSVHDSLLASCLDRYWSLKSAEFAMISARELMKT